MKVTISPSRIEAALACFRKDFFKSVLKFPITKTPWQKMGIDGHQAIESYLLTGSRSKNEFKQKALQVALPVLPEPPYFDTEVELRVNLPYTNKRPKKPKKNRVIEWDQWVNRYDLQVHMYTDLWPYPDTMDTWDWKFRANLSFRNTPKIDLKTDPQAVMYQLKRSYFLTNTWEEPGTHTWQVIDRKQWRREPVAIEFGRGEALERWHTVLEPSVDLILEVYSEIKDPKRYDPAKIMDNGYYWDEDRECTKWFGCDFVRRCMACGTPVFGPITGFLRNHGKKKRR